MLPSRSRFKSLVYTYDSIGLAAKYVSQRQAQPREVWITFDDGPHPVHTVKILDTLRRHKVQATFFWIGQCAEQHPDIVRRAIDDGHYIGNHSYSHPFLTQLTRDEIRREIMRADEVLASYHQSIKLFRPPHGDHNEMVDQVVAEAGYQTILWNSEYAGLALAVSLRAMGHVGNPTHTRDSYIHCVDARGSGRHCQSSRRFSHPHQTPRRILHATRDAAHLLAPRDISLIPI